MLAVFPQPLTCLFSHTACCKAARHWEKRKLWKFLPDARTLPTVPPVLWDGTPPLNRHSPDNIFPRAPMATWAIQVHHYGLILIARFPSLCLPIAHGRTVVRSPSSNSGPLSTMQSSRRFEVLMA